MTTAISPRAIAWRDIVGRLAATGAVMAEWRLVSGVTFYMYLPSSASTGTETVTPDSGVRFDEIAQLLIEETVKLGGAAASNDLGACSGALSDSAYALVQERANGICVSLRSERPFSEHEVRQLLIDSCHSSTEAERHILDALHLPSFVAMLVRIAVDAGDFQGDAPMQAAYFLSKASPLLIQLHEELLLSLLESADGIIPARTRSTTRSARHCLPSAWARSA